VLNSPMDVLEQFPVRKTKVQKKAFRDAVTAYAASLGYQTAVERKSENCQNVIIGDPETAKFLVTAHYDTCARMPIPNFITPCNVAVYLMYQILLVLGLMAVAVAAGMLVGLIWRPMASTVGVVVYWVLLAMLIFGPANPSNANDNTSGVVTLLEIARTMPENQRNKDCLVHSDLEEAAHIGSVSYRKAHKKASLYRLAFSII